MLVSIIIFIFFFLAILIAFITLLLFPLVLIANKTSPGFAKLSICLEKISSKERSLDMDVIIDEFAVRAIEGKDFLFFRNLPINSAAKCSESAAEPPLPQKKILLFLLIAFIQILHALLIAFSSILILENEF